jgi:membrane protease YdiL (CAAX protease family)
MRVCAYCGKENEDPSLHCAGCGTALSAPEQAQTQRRGTKLRLRNLVRDLNAFSGTIILLTYLAAPALCVMCVAVITFVITRALGIHNNDLILRANDKLGPPLSILQPVLGGIATVLMSFWLFPNCVKDRGPNGAALVRGSWKAIAEGFAIGLIVAAGVILMTKIVSNHVHYGDVSPVVRMLSRPGLWRLLSVVTVVLFAPPAEEIVFRGILFGGYRKSFGPVWATMLTTFLFLLLHLPKVSYYLPALAGVSGAALAALWCRLRSGAIGPAIAVHMGGNTLSVIFLLLQSRS